MLEENNRALIYIPNSLAHKVITHGMVLPEGYKVVPATMHYSVETQSIAFVVIGPNIPRVTPGSVLPSLMVEDLGSHLLVHPYIDATGIF